jgi:sugar phosphate isomerase/epimerase
MADALGPRLTHVHLADGTGTPNGPFPDEHLIPGHGSQPCAELLHRLAADNYPGMVVLEVNTRRALNRDERLADLAESLAFAREHLSQVPAR